MTSNSFPKFKPAALIMTLAFGGLTAGCSMENSDDQKIASALSCLDSATTVAAADSCQQKVDGLTSTQSYLIRCSANLIAQGVTGSRLASAFSKLNSAPAAGSQSSQLISYLAFNDGLVNNTAAKTLTNCQASGVQSVIGLAAMASAATSIKNVATTIIPGFDLTTLDPSNPNFNSSALTTVIQTLSTTTDPTTKSTIGNAALAAQSSLCGDGSSLNTQDICKKLNTSISGAGGDPATIGQALLNLIKQQ